MRSSESQSQKMTWYKQNIFPSPSATLSKMPHLLPEVLQSFAGSFYVACFHLYNLLTIICPPTQNRMQTNAKNASKAFSLQPQKVSDDEQQPGVQPSYNGMLIHWGWPEKLGACYSHKIPQVPSRSKTLPIYYIISISSLKNWKKKK